MLRGVAAQYPDAVAVRYAGRIGESAPVHDLFARPAHPYTRGLLACLPGVARRRASPVLPGRRPQLVAIPGQVSSPFAPPPGCAFAPRCTHRREACDARMPMLDASGGERRVRCIGFTEELAA